MNALTSRKPLLVAGAALALSVAGFAAHHAFNGQWSGGTAEACRGGLISYSSEQFSSSGDTHGSVNVDIGKLKATLADAAKRSKQYEQIVANDPEVQRAAQACWQVCQAWASTSGAERNALFGDFRNCLHRSAAHAASTTAAPVASSAPALGSSPTSELTVSGSGNVVNLVKDSTSVTIGAAKPDAPKPAFDRLTGVGGVPDPGRSKPTFGSSQ